MSHGASGSMAGLTLALGHEEPGFPGASWVPYLPQHGSTPDREAGSGSFYILASRRILFISLLFIL